MSDVFASVIQILYSVDLGKLSQLSGIVMLELVVTMMAFVAAVCFVLFLVKSLVIGPHVIMQVSADGMHGWRKKFAAGVHYFRHMDKLKRLYIRDGKLTDKPVHLVRDVPKADVQEKT